MRTVLITWVGNTDLKAVERTEEVGVGPIAQALDGRSFDEVLLVSDYARKAVEPYVAWLRGRTQASIAVRYEKLSGPTKFGEIYEAAVRACESVRARNDTGASLVFHLSPGTPAMAAVWIILGKTRFPAELIESSRQHGVQSASVPFDISVDFIPDILRSRDEHLRGLAAAGPPEAPEFSDIVHRSRPMQRLIGMARKVAVRNVPVLIEGASGTGKELFARAIHRASPRREQSFVCINCGAIPAELIESELFGHEKGAFTGATGMRKGLFESADGGTLFLDEVGELPVAAQVKLLRVLQEGELLRVGSTRPVRIDVRVVAATNRTLTEEVSEGRFREDLFYRLAVAALKIPPLVDRPGDLSLLVEQLLALVNAQNAKETGSAEKKLSAAARNLLLVHPWPGNVRELLNTLHRAVIWTEGLTITAEDVREALLDVPLAARPDVLGRPLGEGLDLAELLAGVARHYLERAMDEAGGNKTKAAALVGLPSYQTLTNWLAKYKVEA